MFGLTASLITGCDKKLSPEEVVCHSKMMKDHAAFAASVAQMATQEDLSITQRQNLIAQKADSLNEAHPETAHFFTFETNGFQWQSVNARSEGTCPHGNTHKSGTISYNLSN